MIKHNLGLFISYLDFFHNIHMKHFKRFAKKMKSMDDYLNEDITFDDSPRRKTSRDFDETSSLISSISGNSDSSSSNSNNGGGGAASHNIDHHEHNKPKIVPRKSETKSSLLKKGVDSVINTFRVFGTKSNPVTPPISSNSSISSTKTPNNSPNLSLHIDEKEYDLVTLNNSVTEFNSTNLTRERKDTINEQLSNDPDLMNKMFDQLTKSLDSPDEHNDEVKEERKSESNVVDIDDDDDNNFGVAIVPDIDCEATEKKKETIDDQENNLLEQSNEENEKPDVDVEDTNKQAAPDQKINKKKRGKKK
jgi:hypothetical protein